MTKMLTMWSDTFRDVLKFRLVVAGAGANFKIKCAWPLI